MPDPGSLQYSQRNPTGPVPCRPQAALIPGTGSEHVLWTQSDRVGSQGPNVLHEAVRAWWDGKDFWKVWYRPPEEDGAVEESNFWSCLSWFPATGNLWVLLSQSARERQPSTHRSPTQGLAKRKLCGDRKEALSHRDNPLTLPSEHGRQTHQRGQPRRAFLVGS